MPTSNNITPDGTYDQFRDDAHNNRDLGDPFERMMEQFLRVDPLHSALFSEDWRKDVLDALEQNMPVARLYDRNFKLRPKLSRPQPFRYVEPGPAQARAKEKDPPLLGDRNSDAAGARIFRWL